MPVPAAPMQEHLPKEGGGLLEHSGDGCDCMSEDCGPAQTLKEATESQSPSPQMMNAVIDKQLAEAESERHRFVHLSGIQKGNSVDEPNGKLCSTLPDMENLDASGSLLDQENPDQVRSVGDVVGFGDSSSYAEQKDVQSNGVIIPSVPSDQAVSHSSGRNHGLAEEFTPD